MVKDKEYEWGRSARLRASRDYLGVSTMEMAYRLKMAQRSYQRMETGQAAIPASLWTTIGALHDQLDTEIASMVDAGKNGFSVLVQRGDTGWNRTVLARALRTCPNIDLRLPDDITAEAEMKDDGHD